jgi:hypothetical protein
MFIDFKASEHELNRTDVLRLRWVQRSTKKLGPSRYSANWMSNQIDFHEPMKVLQKKKRASCSGVNLHANTHNIYVHIKPLKSIFDPAQESQQTCRTKNSICTKSSDTRTNGIYAHIAHIMLIIIYNTCTCTEKTSVHSSKSS